MGNSRTNSRRERGQIALFAAAVAVPLLIGQFASAQDLAQSTTLGVIGDGKLDYVYDPATGDVRVAYDGDVRIDALHPLQRLKLASAAGWFNTTNLNTSVFDTITAR